MTEMSLAWGHKFKAGPLLAAKHPMATDFQVTAISTDPWTPVIFESGPQAPSFGPCTAIHYLYIDDFASYKPLWLGGFPPADTRGYLS